MIKKELKYVIITPAKNEDKYIEYTINSVCSQTLRPFEWIIVDDSSSDNTPLIVEKYASIHNWIKLVKKNNYAEKRSGGSKVVRAFNTGLNNLTLNDYDFIVKLDADLTLPNYYFDFVANEFQKNNKIGICGGICAIKKDGKILDEKSAEYHIRGPIKAYRKECFQEIGGLMETFGWDGIDEFLAMYHGWELKRLSNLKVIHHRETGKETGQFLYSIKIGDFCYKIGYDPFLLFLRSLNRAFSANINLISGIGVFGGYLKAIFSTPKILTKEQRMFIRHFQYSRIKEYLIFHSKSAI